MELNEEQQLRCCPPPRFADVVGIITSTLPPAWQFYTRVVRLTCKEVLLAHDAAVDRFTVVANKLPAGRDGVAELTRFCGRLPKGSPHKLRVTTSGSQVELLEDDLWVVGSAWAALPCKPLSAVCVWIYNCCSLHPASPAAVQAGDPGSVGRQRHLPGDTQVEPGDCGGCSEGGAGGPLRDGLECRSQGRFAFSCSCGAIGPYGRPAALPADLRA